MKTNTPTPAPALRVFEPEYLLLSSGRVFAASPDCDGADLDPRCFSEAERAAADAAAAEFYLYDSAEGYLRREPADSLGACCFTDLDPVGDRLADYFDLTSEEVAEINDNWRS